MNKQNSKIFWTFILFISLLCLFLAFSTNNLFYGILSFVLAVIVNRHGKDLILEDYYQSREEKLKCLKKEKVIDDE